MARDFLAELGLEAPPDLYKNAIDLNRYSNRVAKKLVVSYNRIIANSIKELQDPDIGRGREDRLRLIMGSLKKSLDGWVTKSSAEMKTEITGLAQSQIEFAGLQILDQIRADIQDDLKEIVVSPDFAESIVSTDPTELNKVMLSDDLEERVRKDRRSTYSLGKRDGAALTLPDGKPLEKSFRGIATGSAEKFRLAVQDGMMTGESVDRIARNIIGTGMSFSTRASVRQMAAAGGNVTALANHQIMTLVRTSVNQVANVASQKTYVAAGTDITDKFRFVATLDSRTSLTCASKDGKIYDYNTGPVPPLHFNCRSTTVAVPNWDALEEKYGIQRPDEPAFRASKDGPVPVKQQYGEWLYNQRATDLNGKYQGPGIDQVEALGVQKANFFNQLVARRTRQLTKGGKYKPETAARMAANESIVKLIRSDGAEKSLDEIRAAYKLKEIAIKDLLQFTVPSIPNKAQLEKLATEIRGGELPTISVLQGMPKTVHLSKLKQDPLQRATDLMEKELGKGAKDMMKFIKQRQIFTSWSAGGKENLSHLLGNEQLERSMILALARGTKKVSSADKARTESGLEIIKKALGQLRARKLNMNGAFLGGTKGASGFTRQGTNHVVLVTDSYQKGFTAKRFADLKREVGRSIKASFDGKPMHNANGDHYEMGWLYTFVHEIGHQVHYAAGRPKLSYFNRKALKHPLDTAIEVGTWIPSTYGTTNVMEQFAETFCQYIFDPVALKSASPEAFRWVEDALSVALEAPI